MPNDLPAAQSAQDTQGMLGRADGIGIDLPLLRAVVESDDRLVALSGREWEAPVELDMTGAHVA